MYIYVCKYHLQRTAMKFQFPRSDQHLGNFKTWGGFDAKRNLRLELGGSFGEMGVGG